MLSLFGSWYSWFLLPWHESLKNTNDKNKLSHEPGGVVNSYHRPPSIHYKVYQHYYLSSNTRKTTVTLTTSTCAYGSATRNAHVPLLSTQRSLSHAYADLPDYSSSEILNRRQQAPSHLVSCRSLLRQVTTYRRQPASHTLPTCAQPRPSDNSDICREIYHISAHPPRPRTA